MNTKFQGSHEEEALVVLSLVKVYLRKQSFPTMAEEQNKRLRERERESGESCERMNEMNSNYFILIHLYVNIYIHNLKDRLL